MFCIMVVNKYTRPPFLVTLCIISYSRDFKKILLILFPTVTLSASYCSGPFGFCRGHLSRSCTFSTSGFLKDIVHMFGMEMASEFVSLPDHIVFANYMNVSTCGKSTCFVFFTLSVLRWKLF